MAHSDEYYTRQGAPRPDEMRHSLTTALEFFEQTGIHIGDILIQGTAPHRPLIGLIKTAAMFDREIGSHRGSTTHGGPQATLFAAKMIVRAHGHAATYTDESHLPHFFEGVRGFVSDQLGKFALSYAQPARHETQEIEPAYLLDPKLVEIAQTMLSAHTRNA